VGTGQKRIEQQPWPNAENHPVTRSGCHPSFVRRGVFVKLFVDVKMNVDEILTAMRG
jgi:hypothetical protein